jgi:hypothetical protein
MSDPPTNGVPPSGYPNVPWLSAEYFENQRNFPEPELRKYAGKYVAFSWQGDRILASGDDEQEVRKRLSERGIDPQHVVYGFVDDL